MNSAAMVTELLVRWQESLEQGRDLSAAELCPERPELTPELERRIHDLRRLARLIADVDQAAVATIEHPSPGGTTDGGGSLPGRGL